MTNKIMTATVTIVPIGNLEIEGLLGEDGNFYVAIPQIADSFQILIRNTSRDFKALLGNDFQFLKIKTSLNPKAVNAVDLKTFEVLVAKLDRAGNKAAQSFRDDLAGLALQQLFCDAFGIKYEAEDRQKFLVARQESKELFWELAEAIKVYLDTREAAGYPIDPALKHFQYSNAFDAINLGLFGKKSKQIREELGIGKGALNRDSFGWTALRHLTTVQATAAKKMQTDPKLKPTDAIALVVEFLGSGVIDFQK